MGVWLGVGPSDFVTVSFITGELFKSARSFFTLGGPIAESAFDLASDEISGADGFVSPPPRKSFQKVILQLHTPLEIHG